MLLAAAGGISLICSGGGAHNITHTGTASSLANPEQGVTFQHSAHSDYQDQVGVEISADGAGRIRVPDGLKPRLRSGGEDGWWPLKDMEVRDNEINAKFSMKFMNHPTLRIDRITGHINITGKAGSFRGTCDPYDPAKSQRRF